MQEEERKNGVFPSKKTFAVDRDVKHPFRFCRMGNQELDIVENELFMTLHNHADKIFVTL